jgi:hypothetical protein
MGNTEHAFHLHYQDQLYDDLQEHHCLLRESYKTYAVVKCSILMIKAGGTYT